MILFPTEEANEAPEMGEAEGWLSFLLETGAEKNGEPLHRTKKLRAWPTESARKEIISEQIIRDTGRPPDRQGLEEWKEKQATELWKMITAQMGEEEKERILKEHALGQIAQIISNTIHLEKMYTTLKPIGQRQWELAKKGLRSLTEEESLRSLTEKTHINRKEKIPDWIKGAIIYLALQGSKIGTPMLSSSEGGVVDMSALKTAAEWCLGAHLKVRGSARTLEETAGIFESWNKKREKISLKLVQLNVEDIPQETEVPEPVDINGNALPWNMTWKILPITEKEIRELGEKVLIEKSATERLGMTYRKKILDRWIASVLRRGYIREWQKSWGIAERWKTRTLILAPIDAYVNSRIMGETAMKLVAKTEAAWMMLTEELPEEN